MVSLTSYSRSLLLNCKYKTATFHIFPDCYTCEATVLLLGHEVNVEDVSRNHLAGKSNNDVVALQILNQEAVDFVPQNVNSFFPNLKVFEMRFCGVKTISSPELEQFGKKLEYLSFWKNDLEKIHHDLFKFSQNLKVIIFESNKIRHIDHDVFELTPYLRHLYLHYNVCVSSSSVDNDATLQELKFQLALKCPPTIQMLESQLFSRQKFQTKIDEQISERVNPLVYAVNQLGNQMDHNITNLEERIARLEKELTEAIRSLKVLKSQQNGF